MKGDKKIIIVVVVALAVLLLVAYLLSSFSAKKSAISPLGPAGETTGGPAQLPGGSATREAAPLNLSVPGATSTDIPANVAKPQIVGPANPSNTASFRSFTVSIKGNVFSPDTVIVKMGDIAHINFMAVDKDYDFTQPDYGFYVLIPKGQTKLVEFQATAEGKFTFYCKSCGGPAKGPVGYVVVVPK